MNGKVKFYNVKKGFGFIAGEDGKEYFVHITGLKPGTKLYENDEVKFEVEDTERGPKAVNVSKTGEGSSARAEDSVADEVVEESEDAAEDEDDEEEKE